MTVHFFNLFTTASYAKEPPDSIFAKYAVLLDGDTGRVLYGKNENEKAPMASTTKIMTCIVALENSSLDDMVRVSEKKIFCAQHQHMPHQCLMYSLML